MRHTFSPSHSTDFALPQSNSRNPLEKLPLSFQQRSHYWMALVAKILALLNRLTAKQKSADANFCDGARRRSTFSLRQR
jgi:hypothetical protein